MLSTFSPNLTKFRKRCGLTQSQLAAQLNVTPQAVSKWENVSLPAPEFLPMLARALGVSLVCMLTLAKTLVRFVKNYDLHVDTWNRGAFRVEQSQITEPVPVVSFWETQTNEES